MTEQNTKEKLMDYLYEEMGKSDRREFEKALSRSPTLRKDLEELRSTQNLLQKEQSRIPHRNMLLMNVEKNEDTSKNIVADKSTRWIPTTVFATAAVLLLAALTFIWLNIQIQQTNAGIQIAFGQAPVEATDQPPDKLIEEEFSTLLRQSQKENLALFTELLAETQREQQQQLEQVVAEVTAYYEAQRQQDLLLISETLLQLEEETYYRLMQTDETIEDLIFALTNTTNR